MKLALSIADRLAESKEAFCISHNREQYKIKKITSISSNSYCYETMEHGWGLSRKIRETDRCVEHTVFIQAVVSMTTEQLTWLPSGGAGSTLAPLPFLALW